MKYSELMEMNNFPQKIQSFGGILLTAFLSFDFSIGLKIFVQDIISLVF